MARQQPPSVSSAFTIRLPQHVTDAMDRIAAERGSRRAVIAREAVLFWFQQQQKVAVS